MSDVGGNGPTFELGFDTSKFDEGTARVVGGAEKAERALAELRSAAANLGKTPLDSFKNIAASLNPLMAAVGQVLDATSGMAKAFDQAGSKIESSARTHGTNAGKAFAKALEEQTANTTVKVRYSASVVNDGLRTSIAGADQDAVRRAMQESDSIQSRMRAQALQEDLAGFRQMQDLKVRGEAELAAERSRMQDKALQEDLAGFRQMQDLKLKAAAEVASEQSRLQDRAKAEDLAGFRQMQDLRVRAAAESASEQSRLQAKALQEDLAGFRQMQDLKVKGEAELASERLRIQEKSQQEDLAGFRQMQDLKIKAAAEAAAEQSKLQEKAQQEDLAGFRQMQTLKIKAAAESAAEQARLQGAALQEDLAGFRQMQDLKLKAQAAALAEDLSGARLMKDLKIKYEAEVAAERAKQQERALADDLAGARQMKDLKIKYEAEVAAAATAARARAEASGGSPSAAGPNSLLNNRDLHSAGRGLASGVGAMWLTWGSILPLMAGAAVSNAASQSVGIGAEVGQSLATIKNLGGEGADAIQMLNKALLETSATGPFGPKDVAKALEVMSLAGLKAKEQVEALKPVLDFSVVGQMGIEKSAESLIAIGTAFGYEARDLSVVSDVVAKTAAISMASVEGMSSSFKVASAVAQQYKVSLTDVSTTLALLAQIGIKDQAAGTAVRQMYSELIGSSEKARRVMKDTLKFDVFEANGKSLKDVNTIFLELASSLSKFDWKSQQRILQDLGNERGTKALAANLEAVRNAAKEAGSGMDSFVSKLQDTQSKLADAPGFSALAAIGMNMSSQNQIKSVGAALQTSLVEAFQQVEPAVIRVSRALRDMFNSKEFKDGLSSIISGVATVIEFLVKNADTLADLGKAYLVYQAATLGASATMSAFSVLTDLLGVKTKTTAVAQIGMNSAMLAAAPAAAAAAGGLGALNAAMGVVGMVAAAATAAYFLFYKTKEDGNKKALEDSRATTQETLRQMDDEIARLESVIKARRAGKNEAEAQAQANQDQAVRTILARQQEEVATLRLAHAEAVLARNRLANNPLSPSTRDGVMAAAESEITRTSEAIGAALSRGRSEIDAYLGKAEKLKALARTNADEAEAGRNARLQTPSGSQTYAGQTKQGSNDALTIARKELSNVFADYQNQLKELDQATDFAQKKLEHTYRMGAKSYREYLEESEALSAGHLADAKRKLDEERVAVEEGLAKIQSALAKRPKDTNAEALQADAKAAQERLKAIDAEIKKRSDNEELRRDKVMETTAAPMLEALKAATKLEGSYETEMEHWKAKKLAQADLVNLTDEEAAGRKAAEEAAQNTLNVLKGMEGALQILKSIGFFDDILNPANAERLKALLDIQTKMAAISELSEKAKAEGYDTGVQAERIRKEREYQKNLANEFKTYAKKINETLADAILAGGKDGGAAMRQWLQDELLRRPFKMMLQAAIMPMTNTLAAFLMPDGASAYSAMGGNGNTIGNAGAGGGGTNIFNVIGTASSAYKAASSASAWFSDFGGGVSSSVSKFGNTLYGDGSGTFSNLGGSLMDNASAIGQFAETAGNVMGYVNAVNAISKGKWGEGIGSAAGTYFGGPIGSFVGSTIGRFVDNLFSGGAGTEHAGSLAQYSAATGIKTSQTHGDFGMGFGGVAYDASAEKLTIGMSKNIVSILDSTAKAFGKEVGYSAATAFADDSSSDGAWGGLKIALQGNTLVNWNDTRDSKWAPKVFSDGKAGAEEYDTAVAKEVLAQLEAMNLPKWASKFLDELGQTPTMDEITKVIETIAALPEQTLQALGTSSSALSDVFVTAFQEKGSAQAAGVAVADALVQSIEKTMLGTATQQIIDILNQGIITPIVQSMLNGSTITQALAENNIELALGKARAAAAAFGTIWNDPQFKDLMATIKSGMGATMTDLGTTMGYTPTYVAPKTPTAEKDAAQTEAEKLAQRIADALKALDEDKLGLQADLLRAKGDEAAATLKDIEKATEGWDAANRELYAAKLKENDQIKAQIKEQESLNSLRDEGAKLRVDLLKASNKEEEALAAERAIAIKGMTALEVASYDANQATQKLVDTLNSLNSAIPTTVNKYLTSAQQQANGYAEVAQNLIKAGLSSMDAQSLVAGLMATSKDDLASVAYALYHMAGMSQEAQLALVEATGALAELKDQALQSASEHTDKVMAALQKLAQKRQKDLNDTITNVQAVFDAVKQAAKSLYSEVDSTVDAQAARAREYISQALATAQSTGVLPKAKDLQEAISNATDGIGKAVYASQFEADRDRLKLAGELSQLSDLSEDQLTEAQEQLKAIEDMLETQQNALDELRNGTIKLTSIDDGIAKLTAAIAAEAALRAGQLGLGVGGAKLPTTTTTKPITTGSNGAAYNSSSDVVTWNDASGNTQIAWGTDLRSAAQAAVEAGNTKSVYDAIASSGFSLSQADTIFNVPAGTAEAWAASMGLPVFHDGTNFVPSTGLALLQRGEAVVPAKFNSDDAAWYSDDKGQDGGNDEKVGEGLARVSQALEYVIDRLAAIESHARRTYMVLEDVTEGGTQMRSKAVT